MGSFPEHTKWKPGQSGNPGGQSKAVAELKAMARGYTAQAMQVLVNAMSSDDERLRVVAAQAILERGYGKVAAIDEAAVIREALAQLSTQVLQQMAAPSPQLLPAPSAKPESENE